MIGDKKGIDFYKSASNSSGSAKATFEKVQKQEMEESSSTSHNEEEKKEKHQYKMLKQSLKRLQERASNTFNEEQLGKNYSVSSKADEEEIIEGEPYPQGLISDDESNENEVNGNIPDKNEAS